MVTSVSRNRLQNIFSRYQDNTKKLGVLFKNDSYEQKQNYVIKLSITSIDSN